MIINRTKADRRIFKTDTHASTIIKPVVKRMDNKQLIQSDERLYDGYIPKPNINQIDLSTKSITLFLLSDINLEESIKAFQRCMSLAKFTEYKFLSSRNISFNGVDVIKIPNIISSRKDYSRFILSELNNYISTNYVLICQYDGFIMNPLSWTDEFLKYDYIGAPCNWKKLSVGNGGFSLRSKKLLQAIHNNQDTFRRSGYDPEDQKICEDNMAFLVKNNLNIAPISLAYTFSWQIISSRNPTPYNNQFGMHSGMRDNSYKSYLSKDIF